MPDIFRWNGHRVFFFSGEGLKPPHVHIDKAEKNTKIWLDDLSVAYNEGFTSKELRHILEVVAEQRDAFLRRWYGFFAGRR